MNDAFQPPPSQDCTSEQANVTDTALPENMAVFACLAGDSSFS
jgi:hypothetical protein